MRDIAIIGGGINGCGIARDAAGRGLAVFLAEKDDLASGTSSASTKLIHGGLRYLEHYAFRLVRELLQEREVLLAWRRISSVRCASFSRIIAGCALPCSFGSGFSFTTISAGANPAGVESNRSLTHASRPASQTWIHARL